MKVAGRTSFPISLAWLALALFASSLGCSREEVAPAAPDLIVVVSPVDSRRLEVEILATGELLATEDAVIAAELSGRVTELISDEGDPVAIDQVMLRLDPERREIALSSAQAALGQARAALQEARQEHARILKLHSRGAASSSQLDSAMTTLDAARARHQAALAALGEAERALRDAEVRAPFAGVVDRRLVGRGEYVAPGTSLFRLVANDPLEVVFHLAEVDSARVSLGNPVGVHVASHPEEEFTARVTMIAPTIDARSRTLRVKAELDNSGGRLRPGLFARVDLGIEVRDAVSMIPEEAVLQRAAGPIVFVVGTDSRVAQRAVETGVHEGGRVEVRSGLAPNEWVIIQGHVRLVEGMRVDAQRADGSRFGAPRTDSNEDRAEETP